MSEVTEVKSKKVRMSISTPGAVNDVIAKEGDVKFICDYAPFFMLVPDFDEDGKQRFNYGPRGEVTSKKFLPVNFVPIITKRKDENGNPYSYSFVIISEENYGPMLTPWLLKEVTKLSKNPFNKIRTEDQFFRDRNPEAYQHALEKAEIKSENEELKLTIKNLQDRLGVKTGGNQGR